MRSGAKRPPDQRIMGTHTLNREGSNIPERGTLAFLEGQTTRSRPLEPRLPALMRSTDSHRANPFEMAL